MRRILLSWSTQLSKITQVCIKGAAAFAAALIIERSIYMRGVKLLYGASGLMVFGFCIHLLVDYKTYCTTLNSAPFWMWILVDGLIWLVPAALALAAGLIVKRKLSEKENGK